MIAMQYSLNQDEWVSTALSSMIDDDQLGANLKSATSSCEVNSFSLSYTCLFYRKFHNQKNEMLNHNPKGRTGCSLTETARNLVLMKN